MSYSTKDFNKDVDKLRKLIAKCEQLEEQQNAQKLYKPFRNLNNYLN